MTTVSISIPSTTTTTIASSCERSTTSKLWTSVDKNITIFKGIPLELIKTTAQRIAILFEIGSWVPVSAGLTVKLVESVIDEFAIYWLPV
jgi:hypothetical protein